MNGKYRLGICVLALLTGCQGAAIFDSAKLPVYGSDPLMHTMYIGSDAKFHHFICQHGKTSEEMLVRSEEAVIKPKPFDLSSHRDNLVRSTEPGVIHLLQLH